LARHLRRPRADVPLERHAASFPRIGRGATGCAC
jgi:hypothetical protein